VRQDWAGDGASDKIKIDAHRIKRCASSPEFAKVVCQGTFFITHLANGMFANEIRRHKEAASFSRCSGFVIVSFRQGRCMIRDMPNVSPDIHGAGSKGTRYSCGESDRRIACCDRPQTSFRISVGPPLDGRKNRRVALLECERPNSCAKPAARRTDDSRE